MLPETTLKLIPINVSTAPIRKFLVVDLIISFWHIQRARLSAYSRSVNIPQLRMYFIRHKVEVFVRPHRDGGLNEA